MEKYLTLILVLGATAYGSSLPTMPWGGEDISIMCLISTDYYNKVSEDSALYRLHGNVTEHKTNETSHHQLHFTIKETLCQKTKNEVPDDCAFKEDGLVKSCAASFMVEDERDVIVVTCDNVTPQWSRVRKARNVPRGNTGRNRPGSRTPIRAEFTGNSGDNKAESNAPIGGADIQGNRRRIRPGFRSPISRVDISGIRRRIRPGSNSPIRGADINGNRG
ncbi:cathelicidin-related peptide Oh-Cath-like [Rhinoderma darwinii]|uniref:cathelicidin-related peptide Oh-Cath-like n=1 Tax=Rhinoderma darwinii TaxID=43563 RepID=UPI003F67B2BC